MQRFLPQLVKKYSPAIVIANGENAAGGVGITEEIGRDLFLQVDVLTSGNHIWDKKEALPYLEREPRLLRPANYPAGNPGRGSYIYQDGGGIKIARAQPPGPGLHGGHRLSLPAGGRGDRGPAAGKRPIIIVDFHAEATSEKQALGWHLDGRVSAVIGTHTHVPTADEKILPGGTAYITDAGMCRRLPLGDRHPEGAGPAEVPHRAGPSGSSRPRKAWSCPAVFIEVDAKTGRALSIKREHLGRGEQ